MTIQCVYDIELNDLCLNNGPFNQRVYMLLLLPFIYVVYFLFNELRKWMGRQFRVDRFSIFPLYRSSFTLLGFFGMNVRWCTHKVCVDVYGREEEMKIDFTYN